MIDVKQLTKIMKKYDLQSIEGLLLAHCAFMANEQHPEYLEFIKIILDQLGKGKFSKDSVQEMVDKGIIDGRFIKTPDDLNFANIYLTDEFQEAYYVDSNTAGEELWDAYPNTTIIDGRSVILKKGEKIGDTYWDKDALILMYSKKIGSNKELHQSIVSKIKKAKELGVLNFTLRSFIFDEMWGSLDDLIGVSKPLNDNRTII